jgi:hypothetical protein
LLDGEFDLQIVVNLAEFDGRMLRMSAHAGFRIAIGDLVLADPLTFALQGQHP